MTTVRLFKNGQSQAVRIPRSMAFEGINEVDIEREGDVIVLRPVRKSWSSLDVEVDAVGRPDEEFMCERVPLFNSTRVQF